MDFEAFVEVYPFLVTFFIVIDSFVVIFGTFFVIIVVGKLATIIVIINCPFVLIID